MNKNVERLYNGLIKENPTFVLMLGMCPTLAVTSSAMNGLGMGLSTTVVLVFSNLLISAFRKVIPNGVRMPAFIVIVASLVTMVEFIMNAKSKIIHKSAEITGRFDGCSKASGIMIAHMNSCLIDIGSTRKRLFVIFQYKNLFSFFPAEFRRI